MLKNLLKRLLLRGDLSAEEMAQAVGHMIDGQASPVQVAAFLVALRSKGETVDEIEGAARAMRARMTAVQVSRSPLIDTCGTGGDGAGTFNISTAVALLVAAAGVGVAKHGNRAVSSRSGSADILAELGINLQASPDTMARCIEEVGVGFLFAPTLHPAMRHAAPIRQELGVRTVFNLLGPLTNPAGAPLQLMGVFDRSLIAPLAEVLGRLGSQRAWVVHGADGLDEITVCHETYIAEWDGQRVRQWTLTPEEVGLPRHAPEGLRGGTPAENASILRELFSGQRPGAIEDAVALNAGAALVLAGAASSVQEGLAQARELMRSGEAAQIIERLASASQR